MRICLVYDHLFPQTIGGTERWMRDLALRLAALEHDVTYLTMRHWTDDAVPQLAGVRVVGLVDAGRLYADERRTFSPPLRFGVAVWRHLRGHGAEYDAVHTAAFPYFPLLGAAAARRRARYALLVDWHEVWTRGYWRRYAGRVRGTIGWLVQRACVRVPHRAFCDARMHAARLVAEGYRGVPTVLPGLYDGPVDVSPSEAVDENLVVYAGRHVAEKRVDALVRAFVRAREERPALRLDLYGDGPTRPAVERLVRELGLSDGARSLGRRPEEEVAAALARAACLATASEREGYGLVVVEAAARGVPSVVVAGEDNAATELVEDGVNGFVAPSASPEDLAAAIERVWERAHALRESTADWFAENAVRLSLDESLRTIAEAYGSSGGASRTAAATRTPAG